MLKNKKALLGNQLMIFVFIIILIIIAVSIVTGVSMYYGKEYDFRKVDAQLLNYKITRCLAENEIDFSLPFEKLENEIFTLCDLNKQVIEDNFYIKISVNGELKFKEKDADVCALSDKNENFPVCIETESQINSKTFTVLTGSSQRTKEKVA